MYSSMGDAKGRDIVLNDQSNKTICKNVNLWAYQDTYVSNNQMVSSTLKMESFVVVPTTFAVRVTYIIIM